MVTNSSIFVWSTRNTIFWTAAGELLFNRRSQTHFDKLHLESISISIKSSQQRKTSIKNHYSNVEPVLYKNYANWLRCVPRLITAVKASVSIAIEFVEGSEIYRHAQVWRKSIETSVTDPAAEIATSSPLHKCLRNLKYSQNNRVIWKGFVKSTAAGDCFISEQRDVEYSTLTADIVVPQVNDRPTSWKASKKLTLFFSIRYLISARHRLGEFNSKWLYN